MIRLATMLALALPAPVSPAAAPEAPAPPAGATERAAPAPRAPLPPPGFMDGVLELLRQERYDEARQVLQPVVNNHPGWARAHFYLALTYHKQHRYQQARELFARALELDPDYDTVQVYLGWALYYLGEMEPARAAFEAYLTVKPDYDDAIFALGLIDFDRDHVESARARFNRVIEIAGAAGNRSTEAKSRARLGDVLVRTGEIESAKIEFERSIELNPGNYETYYKLSRVLQQLGDAEGAERARQMHDEVRQTRRPRPAPAEGQGP